MAAVMVTAPSIETQPLLPRPRLVVAASPSPTVFRRRRLAAAGVLLAVFVLAILVVGRVATVLGGTPAVPAHRPGPTSYLVQPGDTLWSIASAGHAGDPRAGVAAIRHVNDLASDTIRPGDVLLLP